MILVSACLAGLKTRYDGAHCRDDRLMEAIAQGEYLALCPEVAGGLSTPRVPAAIVGGLPGQEGSMVLAGTARVMAKDGSDVTRNFVQGAAQVVRRAKAAGVRLCYLKDRSPSCGHDPLGQNPKGGPGQGVLTAMLLAEGFEVREVRGAGRSPVGKS